MISGRDIYEHIENALLIDLGIKQLREVLLELYCTSVVIRHIYSNDGKFIKAIYSRQKDIDFIEKQIEIRTQEIIHDINTLYYGNRYSPE